MRYRPRPTWPWVGIAVMWLSVMGALTVFVIELPKEAYIHDDGGFAFVVMCAIGLPAIATVAAAYWASE